MKVLRLLRVFLLLLILTGCAVIPTDPLSYQNGAGSFSLSGKIDDLAFSAELTLSAVTESGVDARDFILYYTAPASMAGITLIRSAGQTVLTRGGLSLEEPDGRFASMTLPAALFCVDSSLSDAVVVRQNGTTLNRLEAADDEGSYVIWLGGEGVPCRIEGRFGDRTVSVDILRTPPSNDNLP